MIIDLLKQRYSCRNFLDKEIDKEIIQYIVECGRLSSSGGNEQPWKFGIITDKTLINEIAAAAGVNYSQAWVATAPLLIVLCTQLFPDEEIGMIRFPSKHEEIKNMNRQLYSIINMEEHQTKIPGEHMVLAALEHGIFSTWISSIDCEKVGDLLGVQDFLVTNVIAFGYPKKEGRMVNKKEIDKITFTNDFSKNGVVL